MPPKKKQSKDKKKERESVPDRVDFTRRYVCMAWSSHIIAECGSTGYGCQSCSWSAEQGKLSFPCPRSRLKIWSREMGSAVPFRVSLFIIHTQAESGACSRDASRFPRRCPFTVFIKTAIRHRVSPEFIGSRNFVPMTLTAESPPVQGQYSST